MEPWLFVLMFIIYILCALVFTRKRSFITALPQTVNLFASCPWLHLSLFKDLDEDFDVHSLRAFLDACLFPCSSPELSVQCRKVKLVITSREWKAFLTLYITDSGRACFALLFTAIPFHALGDPSKRAASWVKPQSHRTFTNNGNLFQPRGKEDVIRLLFLLPLNFQSKLVENLNVFLSVSFCTSIPSPPPIFLRPNRGQKFDGGFLCP